ncbi:MAG TPA: enoyl-CoA hydratase-related protein [Gammaproteobacteria bacterium]|nr:enoyl-CoA hydratase-related protein [Gammaproteobacteria bacterium]
MSKHSDNERLSLDGLVFEAIRVDVSDHVMTLTLNRPRRKNAINPVMTNELIYAFDVAGQDPEVRVVVIQAEGDVFCAGADLSTMGKSEVPNTTSTVPKRGEIHALSIRLRRMCKPSICKVQGPVLAGALLLVCNATHVIAADHATFSAPEIKRGIWPHMVMAGLFRVMPRRTALDFIMRGVKLDAAAATDCGLINRAVPAAELDGAVLELVDELAGLAPATMRLGLEAFYEQELMPFDEAVTYLIGMLGKTLETEDAREGIAAFMEKREPVWKGR